MSKDVKKLRALLGLPNIICKVVVCLRCGKNFKSKDYPRQRLCVRCRYDDDNNN